MLGLSTVHGDWLGVLDLNGEAWESGGARVKVDCVLAANHLVVLAFGGWSGLDMLIDDRTECR